MLLGKSVSSRVLFFSMALSFSLFVSALPTTTSPGSGSPEGCGRPEWSSYTNRGKIDGLGRGERSEAVAPDLHSSAARLLLLLLRRFRRFASAALVGESGNLSFSIGPAISAARKHHHFHAVRRVGWENQEECAVRVWFSPATREEKLIPLLMIYFARDGF